MLTYLASYLFINTNDALITLVILTILYGIGYGAPFTLTRALMADIVDADELKVKKGQVYFVQYLQLFKSWRQLQLVWCIPIWSLMDLNQIDCIGKIRNLIVCFCFIQCFYIFVLLYFVLGMS